MRPIQAVSEPGFRAHDALIFGEHLANEVKQLLPIPAAVGFWFHDLAQPGQEFRPDQQQLLTADRESTIPVVRDDLLIIPLTGASSERVDVVVHDVDGALLAKMAPEWLTELQKNIGLRFFYTRQIYTDPGTGLYNQRALDVLASNASCWKSLFLVATVSRRRTSSGRYQKIAQIASLLEAVIPDPIFYFGQGVFGCVSRQCDHRLSLDFSHRLITRLKREKLHNVHVGFSCFSDAQSLEQRVDDCWQALVEAQRRGPYSLCDAASLKARDRHPFALPPTQVLRSLQRKWRGLERFGMAVFSVSDESGVPDLESLLPVGGSTAPLADDQQIVLLPGFTEVETAAWVTQAAGKISRACGRSPAAGYSNWPTPVATSRVDCLRNCRKAMEHGSFYGPDAVVGFDFLSLNVSGDLYFDEGDYKQAIREYRTGLQMQPDDVNLLNSLGVALAEVNRHREAVDCFSRALDGDAKNHMALVNKGMSCRLLGRDCEAVHCFEQALLCPDHRQQASLEFYLQLARMYCMNEQYTKAAALLNQWQGTDGAPEEFMFFRILGEACMGAGQNREAVQALQHSLQLYPGNADSLSMLGVLYILEGEGAEVGLSLCDKAVAMDETEPEYLYRRALALFYLSDFDQALIAVRAALRLQTNFDRAVLLRGRIYEGAGHKGKARQSYQRVLAMKKAGSFRKKQAVAGLKRLSTR